MHNDLKKITDNVLYGQDNIGGIFADMRLLHNVFAHITGISANLQDNSGDIVLPSGKAIGPQKAAHCLLEALRTAVFIRGIHKAILEQLEKFPGKTINILYAGCGPYATLLTPLTEAFTPEQVQFHLLDINETSLAAVKHLYETLGQTAFVAGYIHADAAEYKSGREMDIIISETMQAALKKEPQVSIMQNLIPQLPEHGIFIPQEIRISAQLLDLRKESESFSVEGMVPERINLGEIYSISRQQYTGHQPVTVAVPETIASFSDLHLMTDIRVFENEILTAYNSSLNLPLKITDARPLTGKNITFYYETGTAPGFQHQLN